MLTRSLGVSVLLFIASSMMLLLLHPYHRIVVSSLNTVLLVRILNKRNNLHLRGRLREDVAPNRSTCQRWPTQTTRST